MRAGKFFQLFFIYLYYALNCFYNLNKMKQTKLINIYGGPGAGKSTAAAGVFYNLKKLGYDCGLVTEMATELVYDEAFNVINDQLYLFAEQWHRTFRMLGKVDFIVTDSPFLLNIVYNKNDDKDFNRFIFSKIHSLDSLDFFINRSEVFSGVGRIHSLEQSKEIDKVIKKLAKENGINLIDVEQNNAVEKILEKILN